VSGRFLLDTNIVIGIFQGDTAIQNHLRSAGEVLIPSIALGELYYGALKSERHNENIKIIREFSSGFPVLSCDSITALFYGEIKEELKNKGKPIPENDIWIAAVAKQHSLILASRDKHFSDISNLKTESWT
jgi:tRNA(fMet)-specific endonuclease VapC